MSNLFLKRMSLFNNEVSTKINNDSNLLMTKNFSHDGAYKKAILYDWNMKRLDDIDIKYQYSQNYTINKDQVEHLVQFPPLYHPEQIYKHGDGLERLGFFLDIPDDTGKYYKWLVLGRNDSLKFTRYNILKCNWVFKYVNNGKVYEQLGVLRDRNNYNSGVWSDGFVTSVENQAMFIVPTNDNTELIDYGMRFMLSDNKKKPLVYEVTKRTDTFPLGIQKIILSQDHYNEEKDDTHLGVCDYHSPAIQENSSSIDIELKYNGTKPVLYLGGSKRIITASMSQENDISTITEDNWSFDVNKIPQTKEKMLQFFTIDIINNQLQIAAKRDFSMVGNIVTVHFTYQNQTVDLQLEVVTR